MNGEVVVSMRRMDKIREIDPASNTMTCEAGVVLQTVQQRASEIDRLFPLSLGAEGSCTIGGNLSTNAGGNAALAYGVAREMALGLEVVLADGRILNGLSKLKKDNTGYDLRNLFIGAEGTLGIITAATLKLFPKPRAVATAFVGLQSPAQALKLLEISQNAAAGELTSFELLARIALDFTRSPRRRNPRSPGRQPSLVCADGTVVGAGGCRRDAGVDPGAGPRTGHPRRRGGGHQPRPARRLLETARRNLRGAEARGRVDQGATFPCRWPRCPISSPRPTPPSRA